MLECFLGGFFLYLLFFSKYFANTILELCARRLITGDVLDCGAGIGRVSGSLLLDAVSGSVDMIEQCEAFTARARTTFAAEPRVRTIITGGLQELSFAEHPS
jgi:hypothetical protein